MKNLTFAIALFLAAFTVPPVAQADWPAFRGLHGDGHASTPSLLSQTSDVELKVRWKRPLGSGYSSVVVANGLAVTGYCDDESDYVGCFESETGQQVWKYKTGPKYKGTNGSFDGPVATPAIGGGQVFMFTPAGDLIALNLKTGDLVWELNVIKKFGATPLFYGFGASPIFIEGKLFVQIGPKAGTLCAIDPKSGELLWKVGQDEVGYQNPVLATIAGKKALLVAGNTELTAVSPEDGTKLFKFAHDGKGFQGSQCMIPVLLENNRILLTHDDARSRVIELAENEGKIDITPVWEESTIRNTYSVPAASQNRIYGYNSRVLTCVNAETGERIWRSRSPGDGFLSITDKHLITLTKKGTLHIANVESEAYDEKCEAQVFDDTTWAIPAVDGNAIYVRSLTEIARVDIVPRVTAAPQIAKQQLVGPKFKRFLSSVKRADNPQQVVERATAFIKKTPLVEGNLVYFILRGDYEDVAVVSDLFGSRQSRSMEHLEGTDLFYLATEVPRDARFSYGFVANYKTITDPRNQRKTKSTIFVEDMEYVFIRPDETLELSWFDMPEHRKGIELEPTRQLSGKLESFNLTSQAMQGAKIPVTVLLPKEYKETGTAYPVLFVHDGLSARKVGRFDHLADRMQDLGLIEKSVIVFIDRPFHPMMGFAGYQEMFTNELLPEIDNRYNVSTERTKRSTFGTSFGGMFALTTGLTARDQIGRIGIPAIHRFDMHQPMIDAALAVEGPKVEIMLQRAKFGIYSPLENVDMNKMTVQIAKQLTEAGHTVDLDEVNDGSDWVCWSGQSDLFLRFLLEK